VIVTRPHEDRPHGVEAGESTGWWLGGAVVVVTVPIVVATVRALAKGWLALGDVGLLGIRVTDVGSRHHPWLGSWSSSSMSVGVEVHNPGPLYFDLAALPTKLLGPSVGLAVGVMAVNVAAAVIAVVVARRTAGRQGLIAVTAAVVAIEWTLGSELLFDIWQPNALVLPTLAMIVVTWGLAAGDLAALPLLFGIASVIVQTHLSFVYLASLLVAVGAVFAVAASSGGRSCGWGRWRRPLAASGIVLAVAWVQPLWQQLFGEGPGNVSSLLSAAGRDSTRLGIDRGVQLMAARMVLPPWWGRSSYDDEAGTLPSIGVALLALVALVVVLVLMARRVRADRALRRMVDVSLAVLAGCFVTFALMPQNVTGFVPHTWRWLWPAAAFVTVTLLAAATVLMPSSWRTFVRGGAVAVILVLAAAALPTHVAGTGPSGDRDVIPTAAALVAQADALEGRGGLLFDASTLAYEDPYHTALLVELQRHGVPFVFDGPYVEQFGDARRDDGTARWRIWQRTGQRALGSEPGASRVLFVEGLDVAQAARLDELDRTLAAPLDAAGLTLTAEGRQALERGELTVDLAAIAPRGEAFDALDFIGHLVTAGLVAPPPQLERELDELLELRRVRDRYTVAVFIAPASVRPAA